MSLSVAILYPEPLKAALSNLALHFLFGNSPFTDKPDIFTLDSSVSLFQKKKLTGFDVVLVSFSYEYSLFNLVRMFNDSGIPFSSEKRRGGTYPLIVVGGPVVSLNPALFTSIFDLVINGEGEMVMPLFSDIIGLALQKDATLFEKYPWISSLDSPHSTRIFAPSREFGIFSDEKLLTFGNEFGNRVIVEMNRGCTAACRFCVASYLYKPFRPASLERVREAISLAEKHNRGVALMGTSIGDYPEFDDILEELAEKKINISLSSLKGGAINEKRLKYLKKCGVKTVTLAIESADPEVRKRITKPLSQQTIVDALSLLHDYHFRVKLYFIAGLPETDPTDEVASIIELLLTLQRGKRLPYVTVSIAPLSPKLLTPYADEKMMGKTEFRRYITLLKKQIRTVSPHIAIYTAPYREAVVQTWLTRADEKSLLSLFDGTVQGLSIRDAERAAGIKMDLK